MELATADVAHIKNKDTKDLDKMCTTKVQLRYKRRKGYVLGAVKMARETNTVSSIGENLF